jgi:hypothetical protein
MAVNKVIANGKVLIDLTGDTVTAGSLKKSVTAHDKSGAQIVGTLDQGKEIDDIDIVLAHGFSEGTRTFAENGTITEKDSQGRTLIRVFSEDGRVCTSDLSDENGYSLGTMSKVYNVDFSEVTVVDRHGNVTVRKIAVIASGTSTEVVNAE